MEYNYVYTYILYFILIELNYFKRKNRESHSVVYKVLSVPIIIEIGH